MCRRQQLGSVLLAAALCGCGGSLRAAAPAAPKVSSFAPIGDVVQQIEYYVERTVKASAEKSEFDDGAQARLKKDANTIAVLGLALALHDEAAPLKAHAAAIVAAAQALAAHNEDFEQATKAVASLKQAVAAGGSTDSKLTWTSKVGALSPLMHQVPFINNGLKKGVAATNPKAAPNAATLAVIAQASMADTSAVKNPADLAKWYEFCAAMREGAAKANAGLHAQDKAATAAGMKILSQSCEDCHAIFRKTETK
ncbi:MAG TPA: hypothetical protein VFE24_08010 [Pirellulales bacterium]|jgi:cytochrome c556|nr:hypothetical protein [Pirellulales bacterium]